MNLPKINKKYLLALILLVAVIVTLVLFFSDKAEAPVEAAEVQPHIETKVKTADTVEKSPKPEPKQPAERQPKAISSKYPITYNLSQAAVIDVVVNKKHRLPSNYVPELQSITDGNLRPEAAKAFSKLLSGAKAAGNPVRNVSAYRSYQQQVHTYNGWVAQSGQAEADRYSARPGFSEHQTGLAVDVGPATGDHGFNQNFAHTPAGKWIAKNAHKYGFIVRYPHGKEAITGYTYEPWHLRYVGVGLAQAIFASGKTMEQYFNIPGGGY